MARQLVDEEYIVDPPFREPRGLFAWGQNIALALTRTLTLFANSINRLQSRVGFEGHVTSAAAITTGNQFSVVKDSTGNYTVSYKDYGTAVIPTVQAINSSEIRWTVHTVSTTSFKIKFWNSSGSAVDTAFYFSVRGFMEVPG